MQKTKPKMLKNQKNLSIFGFWDLDWSWLIISIQTMFWFFHFRTQKNICWVKTKHSLKSFGFLVLLEFFVFCFSIDSHDCHLYPYACLPYRSWDVKLWSKFLIQELARYVRPSLAYDVLWCSCTWILSQDLSSGFSFSVSQFFSFWPKISPQDSAFQFLNFWLPRFTQRVLCKSWNLGYVHTHSCLGLTYSSKKVPGNWHFGIIWGEWWGISLRTCNICFVTEWKSLSKENPFVWCSIWFKEYRTHCVKYLRPVVHVVRECTASVY